MIGDSTLASASKDEPEIASADGEPELAFVHDEPGLTSASSLGYEVVRG